MMPGTRTALGSEGIELNDGALVRRVVEGDEAALAIIYDRYAGVVYSTVRRVLADAGAAEEVLQDIFYHLWRNASRFDVARGSLAGWLLVSARHRAIDRLRRRDRAPSEAIEDHVVVLPSRLESQLLQSEMMAKVKSILGSLPEPQRVALELAYFQGMTHSEIARQTGEPLGTVKTRLRSALSALRQILNP